MELTYERYSVTCSSPYDAEMDLFLSIVGKDPAKKFLNNRWYISRSTLKKILLCIPESKLNIRPDTVIGSDMKLSLYEYQKDAVEFGLDGSSLFAYPCGAGKTAIMIALFLENRKSGKIPKEGKGLIVVKSSLKFQWLQEVSKFSSLKACIIDTYKSCTTAKQRTSIKKIDEELEKQNSIRPRNRAEIDRLRKERSALEKSFFDQFDLEADLYIANYETLKDPMVKNTLHKMNLYMVAADEIHLIKDSKAARSKALCEFADVPLRYGATATPIKKNPLDAYGIAKFIKPGLFSSEATFKSRYINFNRFGGVAGSKNERELNEKLGEFMIHKNKEDISSQLPEVVVITRYCKLTDKQLAMTDQLMEEIKELKDQEYSIMTKFAGNPPPDEPDLRKAQAGILARQTFALELADTEELLEMSDTGMAKNYVTKSKSDKMETLLDLVEELTEAGEKVVIFSRYQRMQKIIEREITSRIGDVKIAFVNGSLTSQQRYEEVYTKFRDDPDYKVLVMSDAGAEGISISWCRYLIEMEPADSYLIQTQRRGRIERADSVHDTVYVYQLIAEDSFDEVCLKIIDKKEQYDTQIIKGELD